MREYRIIKAKKEKRILPAQDFFQGQLVENKDKFFTFIVLTHNKVDVIDANFQSIMNQKYPHYDVIYIDQMSTDGTVEQLRELIQKNGEIKQVKLIETQKDYQAFQTYFNEICALHDERVIVHLSGNDILAHDEVLKLLERVYTNPDVWMSYGQYLDYYSYQKGIYEPKPQKLLCKKRVQRAPWLLASLKTFYAGHFKKIKRSNIFEDFFLSIKNENSLLLPLAELGKAHVQFIPDVLYIHTPHKQKKKQKLNLSIPIIFKNLNISKNQFSKFSPIEVTSYPVGKSGTQKDQVVKYDRYKAKTIEEIFLDKKEGADVIIFSKEDPQKLEWCLESIKKKMQGVAQISIIYHSQEKDLNGYEDLQVKYPNIKFLSDNLSDFKSTFFQALTNSSASYVILSSDEVILKEKTDLSACIEAMRKSHAYGFYFHLGWKDHQSSEGIFSWIIENGEDVWREPNVFKMALYRKIDLEKDFKEARFNSLPEWKNLWSRKKSSYFGLTFDKPKSIPFAESEHQF